MKITVHKQFGTSKWEVIGRYGYREELIAVRDTRQAAIEYKREYIAAFREFGVAA